MGIVEVSGSGGGKMETTVPEQYKKVKNKQTKKTKRKKNHLSQLLLPRFHMEKEGLCLLYTSDAADD